MAKKTLMIAKNYKYYRGIVYKKADSLIRRFSLLQISAFEIV